MIRRALAWWDLKRRQRRVMRRFRNLGPADQARVVIVAIERDAELRQRFRQALGVNVAGKARRGKRTGGL